MTPEYKQKLEQGLHYQDFVIEKLYDRGLPIISYASKEYQNMIGENKAGIEIKNDTKFSITGNFYVEIAEKSNANNLNYIASGIFRNDNTWLYVIGNKEWIYVFAKNQLILLYNAKIYKEVITSTSQGFLLPIKDAREKWAIKIIEC